MYTSQWNVEQVEGTSIFSFLQIKLWRILTNPNIECKVEWNKMQIEFIEIKHVLT